MTTGSQLHGARWPRFNCVQMIETMSLAAADCILAPYWLSTFPELSRLVNLWRKGQAYVSRMRDYHNSTVHQMYETERAKNETKDLRQS